MNWYISKYSCDSHTINISKRARGMRWKRCCRWIFKHQGYRNNSYYLKQAYSRERESIAWELCAATTAAVATSWSSSSRYCLVPYPYLSLSIHRLISLYGWRYIKQTCNINSRQRSRNSILVFESRVRESWKTSKELPCIRVGGCVCVSWQLFRRDMILASIRVVNLAVGAVMEPLRVCLIGCMYVLDGRPASYLWDG